MIVEKDGAEMLFKSKTLNAIKLGKVQIAFRRWKKPAAISGHFQMTAIGRIKIVSVDPCTLAQISEMDAIRAGFECRSELLTELRSQSGKTYRIELRYAGADPRLKLRERARLSQQEFNALNSKLNQLDEASHLSPWTKRVLEAIRKHPNLAARDLAELLGMERAPLKLNIRKLKNLGLTISHHPGYELSKRGVAYLSRLTKTPALRSLTKASRNKRQHADN